MYDVYDIIKVFEVICFLSDAQPPQHSDIKIIVPAELIATKNLAEIQFL